MLNGILILLLALIQIYMALQIATVALLKDYLNGVMSRADHHGQNVNEIVLTLIGAVIWKAQNIDVGTYKDTTTNVLWLTVNNNRYVLAYNHDTGNIEIRVGSLRGHVLATFNNTTTALNIKSIFSAL